MGSVEQEIQDLVAKRLSGPAALASHALHGMEEFAIKHMGSLAIGAAGAVLSLTAIMAFSNPEPHGGADETIVGSIDAGVSRVPSGQSWKLTQKPVEAIALQAPQFQRHPAQYLARMNEAGGREDSLLFEPASLDMPEAKVTLRRGDVAIAPSLFIDMARQQAERGVAVVRSSTPGTFRTKFGEMEAADMTFTDEGGRNQSCLAFRSSGPISLTGWFCAAQSAVVERPEVACFIDRLMLMKSGEDKDLRKFFAAAERNRHPCPTLRVSTGRKPSWLDVDGKAPHMRGDVTGSISAKGEKSRR